MFDFNEMEGSFLSNLKEAINDSNTEYVSFDFFDTLVFRFSPRPSDVFINVAQDLEARSLLAVPISGLRFMELRQLAEAKARALYPGNEVTLDEIYEQFPPELFSGNLEQVVESELAIEKKLIRLNPVVLNLLEYARSLNKKIIIISDTYFSTSDLYGFLGPKARSLYIQDIFVSNNYRTHKATNLFGEVLKRLQVSANAIVHCGDNYNSDVVSAARFGIRSFLLPNGSSEVWTMIEEEDRLIHHQRDDMMGVDGDSGITSMRSKLLPLQENPICRKHKKYGMEVLGPVLSYFGLWVLQQSQELKVYKCISLMREGYLISKILSELSSDSPLSENLDTAYISRRIVIQASIFDVNKETLSNLIVGRTAPSLKEYLSLIGLELSDLPQFGGRSHVSLNDMAFRAEVVESILADSVCIHSIEVKSARIRNGLLKHLLPKLRLNEYSEDGVPTVALIDIGWNGTIQKYLQNIFLHEGINIKFVGFYLMTTPNVNPMFFDEGAAYGFCVDSGYPVTDYKWLIRTLEILEQSCSPPWGSSIGYTANGEPIVADSLLPAGQLNDIKELQEGVLETTRWLKSIGLDDITLDKPLKKRLRLMLLRAMVFPSKSEVSLFMSWMHDENLINQTSEGIIGDHYLDFIKYMTPKQIATMPMSDVYWPFGLAAAGASHISGPIAMALASNGDLDTFESGIFDTMRISLDPELDANICQLQEKEYSRNVYGLFYQSFLFSQSGRVLRITPCTRDTILRIDRVRISMHSRSNKQNRVVDLRADDLLSSFKMNGIRQISKNVFAVSSGGYFDIALDAAADSSLYELEVEVAGEALRALDNFEISGLKDSSVGAVLTDPHFAAFKRRKGMKFCIDSINGRAYTKDYKESYFSSGERVSIHGWAFDSISMSVCSEINLALVGNEKYYIRANKAVREDVGIVFSSKLLNSSGFSLDFDLVGISPGSYSVYLLGVLKDEVIESSKICAFLVDSHSDTSSGQVISWLKSLV